MLTSWSSSRIAPAPQNSPRAQYSTGVVPAAREDDRGIVEFAIADDQIGLPDGVHDPPLPMQLTS